VGSWSVCIGRCGLALEDCEAAFLRTDEVGKAAIRDSAKEETDVLCFSEVSRAGLAEMAAEACAASIGGREADRRDFLINFRGELASVSVVASASESPPAMLEDLLFKPRDVLLGESKDVRPRRSPFALLRAASSPLVLLRALIGGGT
jgi:hypothetical protein